MVTLRVHPIWSRFGADPVPEAGFASPHPFLLGRLGAEGELSGYRSLAAFWCGGAAARAQLEGVGKWWHARFVRNKRERD